MPTTMPSRLALLLACAPFGAMAFVPSSVPHFGPRAATTLAASESGTEIGRAEMLRGLMAASALMPFAAFADEGDVVVAVTEAAPVKAPQEIPTGAVEQAAQIQSGASTTQSLSVSPRHGRHPSPDLRDRIIDATPRRVAHARALR